MPFRKKMIHPDKLSKEEPSNSLPVLLGHGFDQSAKPNVWQKIAPYNLKIMDKG
jgi:hypothetical protein